MKKPTITVITPTYNRKDKLVELYKSLSCQTSFDFDWLIIDDGSIDNTETVVREIKEKECRFAIRYIKKQNGGKHTALNKAFRVADGELSIIVDSDDKLIEDAIKIIKKDWNKYKNKKDICALCYKRKNKKNIDICDDFGEKEIIANYNEFIINRRIRGDKAEVFITEIINKYRFPSFKDEKFIGEGVLWSKISNNYDMVFINEAIYICDYLDDGLTKSGRKMRLKSPKGGMYHSHEYMSSNYKIDIRLKNATLYIIYSLFAKEKISETIKNSGNRLLMISCFMPAYLIYLIWKKKYES